MIATGVFARTRDESGMNFSSFLWIKTSVLDEAEREEREWEKIGELWDNFCVYAQSTESNMEIKCFLRERDERTKDQFVEFANGKNGKLVFSQTSYL